jgi:hypothetical protein
MKRVRYWNSGSPSYRWVAIALNQIQTKGLSNPRNARALALMNIAIYDAMVSAWGSKYEFNRPRPAQVDGSVPVAIDTPKSPSYPSELAVAAGAASVVLIRVARGTQSFPPRRGGPGSLLLWVRGSIIERL